MWASRYTASGFLELPYEGIAPLPMVVPDIDGNMYLICSVGSNGNSSRSAYDIVTAAETYDVAVEQYVRSRTGVMPKNIDMLLIYCDNDSQLYHTLEVRLSLRRVGYR